MFGIPIEELAVLSAVLLFGGVLTGLMAGLLGIGGGAIIVPVLYYLFGFLDVPLDIRMHLCVGTSLAIIIPTSIRSFRSHYRRGAVDIKTLRLWAVPLVLGVVCGALVAAIAPSVILELVFGLFGVLVGGQMLFLGSAVLKFWSRFPGRLAMSLYGWSIGLVSSLVGIGGGSLATLVFVMHGRTMLQGIATGSGAGVLISIPGALGFIAAGWPQMENLPPFSLGYVSFIGALLIAPVSMLAAPLGVRIAHAFTPRQLEIALGLFLVTMGGRFLFSVGQGWLS
jgi:uncharacterized membrane protein YfcA